MDATRSHEMPPLWGVSLPICHPLWRCHSIWIPTPRDTVPMGIPTPEILSLQAGTCSMQMPDAGGSPWGFPLLGGSGAGSCRSVAGRRTSASKRSWAGLQQAAQHISLTSCLSDPCGADNTPWVSPGSYAGHIRDAGVCPLWGAGGMGGMCPAPWHPSDVKNPLAQPCGPLAWHPGGGLGAPPIACGEAESPWEPTSREQRGAWAQPLVSLGGPALCPGWQQ